MNPDFSHLKRAAIFCALCAIITACVSTNATLLIPGEQYEPVSPDLVRIYTDESELDTLEYIRVAIIESTGSTTWTSQAGMYKSMRKKAAKLGCNGVLLSSIDEPGAGAKVAGAFLGVGTKRRGHAYAIRVIGVKRSKANPVPEPNDTTIDKTTDTTDVNDSTKHVPVDK